MLSGTCICLQHIITTNFIKNLLSLSLDFHPPAATSTPQNQLRGHHSAEEGRRILTESNSMKMMKRFCYQTFDVKMNILIVRFWVTWLTSLPHCIDDYAFTHFKTYLTRHLYLVILLYWNHGLCVIHSNDLTQCFTLYIDGEINCLLLLL